MKKPISGHLFEGTAINDEQVVVRTTLNQLEALGVKSPHLMATTTLKNTDKDDVAAKQLRMTIQRAWDKPRSERADSYADYERKIIEGKIKGGTPPVTLFSPQKALISDDGSVMLPFRCTVIAIDGETQTEARYRLRDMLPQTGDEPFAAVLYHGISYDHAMQILHDFNRFAKPIPESKLGSRNVSGGVSKTIAAALSQAGYAMDDLNRTGNAGTNRYIASYSQSMVFAAGYTLGSTRGLLVNGATAFDELNKPGAAEIPCVDDLAHMYTLAHTDIAVRRMPTQFWQVAGILAAEGFDVAQLNWAAAIETDKKLMEPHTGQQGGSRVPRSVRQQVIYNALKPSAIKKAA